MGLIIVYSKTATLDLNDIYNYIRRDSIRYAKEEIKLIRASVRKLKTHPLTGKQFEKAEDEFTRELIFRNYRIVYQLVPDMQIEILTIHHHSRLLSNNPAFKDEE